MTDDITGIALWDDDIADSLEDRLPIPEELRQRIKAWVREFTDSIGGDNPWGRDELMAHDRRGYRLSLELQEAVGSAYRIEYRFETSGVRREVRHPD